MKSSILFKTIFIVTLLSLSGIQANNRLYAQKAESKESFQVYKVYADAAYELKYAKERALKAQKNIIIFVGGNWCVWCRRLDAFLKNDPELSKALGAYEVMHINYSKENKNEKILATFNNPQQFGFPVIVLLDHKGNYMATQNTGDLEEGKGYSKEKIRDFLHKWSYKNINHQ